MVAASGGTGAGSLVVFVAVLLLLKYGWRPTVRAVWTAIPSLPPRRVPLTSGGWFDKRRSRLIRRDRKRSTFTILADIGAKKQPRQRGELWLTPTGSVVVGFAHGAYSEVPPNEAVGALMQAGSLGRLAARRNLPEQYHAWLADRR